MQNFSFAHLVGSANSLPLPRFLPRITPTPSTSTLCGSTFVQNRGALPNLCSAPPQLKYNSIWNITPLLHCTTTKSCSIEHIGSAKINATEIRFHCILYNRIVIFFLILIYVMKIYFHFVFCPGTIGEYS